MKMTPVSSSNIAALSHDPITLKMRVKFHTGKIYEYDRVPVATFDAILKADSVGSAFNKLVKTKPLEFPFTQVSA